MARRGDKFVVLKFGGTSMGSQDSIRRVREIVLERASQTAIAVVVSAMAGVTDRLLRLGEDALRRRNRRVESELESLRLLHEEGFFPLVEKTAVRTSCTEILQQEFDQIRAMARGISLLREFSDRTRYQLMTFGEILSSSLLAQVLRDSDARFVLSDAREWVVAEGTHQGPLVDFEATERLARRRLKPLLRRGGLPVVPGFVCRNPEGEIATLGRNGSDYSASVAGAVMGAKEIWIYTDVDGILTADPGLVAEAAILSQISYQEAAEMSFFGAKVIHPKTMIPAVLRRIPIRIKNTFNPGAPGTLITGRSARRPRVKTVTSVGNLSLLNIQGNGMVGIPGVSSRLFEALAARRINVMMISQSSSEHSICTVIQAKDADLAVRAIREEFEVEIGRNLLEKVDLTRKVAIVSIIGEGMRGTPGISGKFFDALGKHRVNVLAIAQGSSERNISAAILERQHRRAVRAVHTAFGLTRELNVFVFGCGLIGRMLLSQLCENRRNIARHLQVDLRVLGVANSRSMLFREGGLREDEMKSLGEGAPLDGVEGAETRPATEAIFRRIGSAYKTDIVVVDATGAELADTHIGGLRRGLHIVTANKKPLTSSWAHYREIQKLRRRKGLQYQYEATFGAGLPLLHTLQDLVQTGDQILRIQGCLSGTLGFLCSRLDEGAPISKAVTEAMSLGYTEPDPRDDLGGVDVARKALIIAREMGLKLELEDIRLQPMIPRRFLRAPSIESFLERLPGADPDMAERVSAARGKGLVLRYLADIGPDGCEVRLGSVPKDSPIGRLAGPDNILVFQTQRYQRNPMVIQGPGAGAGVTAAGVLGDILKIAKSI